MKHGFEEFENGKKFMMDTRTMKKTKNIAFIVSDNRKSELIEWSYFNRDLLVKHEIIAVGPAITILEGTLNKNVNKLISGPLGGFKMMADLIKDGKIDALVFFSEIENQRDFETLLQSAIEHNVIIAFNKSTADFIFNSPLLTKEYFVKIPSTSNPKKGNAELRREKIKTLSAVKAA